MHPVAAGGAFDRKPLRRSARIRLAVRHRIGAFPPSRASAAAQEPRPHLVAAEHDVPQHDAPRGGPLQRFPRTARQHRPVTRGDLRRGGLSRRPLNLPLDQVDPRIVAALNAELQRAPHLVAILVGRFPDRDGRRRGDRRDWVGQRRRQHPPLFDGAVLVRVAAPRLHADLKAVLLAQAGHDPVDRRRLLDDQIARFQPRRHVRGLELGLGPLGELQRQRRVPIGTAVDGGEDVRKPGVERTTAPAHLPEVRRRRVLSDRSRIVRARKRDRVAGGSQNQSLRGSLPRVQQVSRHPDRNAAVEHILLDQNTSDRLAAQRRRHRQRKTGPVDLRPVQVWRSIGKRKRGRLGNRFRAAQCRLVTVTELDRFAVQRHGGGSAFELERLLAGNRRVDAPDPPRRPQLVPLLIRNPDAIAWPQVHALERHPEPRTFTLVLLLVQHQQAHAVRLATRGAAHGRDVALTKAVPGDQGVVDHQLDRRAVGVLRILPGHCDRRVAFLPPQTAVLELSVDHVCVAQYRRDVAVAVDRKRSGASLPGHSSPAAGQHPVDHLARLITAPDHAVEPPARLLLRVAVRRRHEFVAALGQLEEVCSRGAHRCNHAGNAAQARPAVRQQVVHDPRRVVGPHPPGRAVPDTAAVGRRAGRGSGVRVPDRVRRRKHLAALDFVLAAGDVHAVGAVRLDRQPNQGAVRIRLPDVAKSGKTLPVELVDHLRRGRVGGHPGHPDLPGRRVGHAGRPFDAPGHVLRVQGYVLDRLGQHGRVGAVRRPRLDLDFDRSRHLVAELVVHQEPRKLQRDPRRVVACRHCPRERRPMRDLLPGMRRDSRRRHVEALERFLTRLAVAQPLALLHRHAFDVHAVVVLDRDVVDPHGLETVDQTLDLSLAEKIDHPQHGPFGGCALAAASQRFP